MNLILLSGKMGSGKSWSARYLKGHYEGYAVRSFATLLRDEMVAAGFARELIYNKPTVPVVRAAMQAWGDLWRTIDPRHYITVMENELIWIDKISLATNTNTHTVIIDDLRYRNEAQWGKDRGGTLLRLTCSTDTHDGNVAGHQSETDLDDWSWDMQIACERGALAYLADRMDDLASLNMKTVPRS